MGEVCGDHGAVRLEAAHIDQFMAHTNDFRNAHVRHIAAFNRAFRALGDDSVDPDILQEAPGRLLVPAGICSVEKGCAIFALDDVVEAGLLGIVLSEYRRHSITIDTDATPGL